MNMEAINRINTLVREEKDLQKTIDEMDEQTERIRKYCLEALEDAHETAEAVIKVVEENTHLFEKIGICATSYTVRGNEGYLLVNLENRYIKETQIIMRGMGTRTESFGKCWCWGDMSDVEAIRKEINEAKGLVRLSALKNTADSTKLWAETILSILESHMKDAVAKRKRELEAGVHDAAEEYTKVA